MSARRPHSKAAQGVIVMRTIRFLLASLALLAVVATSRTASADGCYICERGSSSACRDYCRYSGAESYENRHRCEARGCRIGGTASCPGAANLRVCLAPVQRAPLAVCDHDRPNG
ncbi:MAG: hypothetical protein JWM10_145 [Myxococcaceae bacterium]|nr:hypothetical protein [Myxococcaceae bacterium]